jgi:hypothetical protein
MWGARIHTGHPDRFDPLRLAFQLDWPQCQRFALSHPNEHLAAVDCESGQILGQALVRLRAGSQLLLESIQVAEARELVSDRVG